MRSLQTLIRYAKAMAYFRGRPVVGLDDLAAVLPFALRGKLLPNELHPRFDVGADRELATDSISWLARPLRRVPPPVHRAGPGRPRPDQRRP